MTGILDLVEDFVDNEVALPDSDSVSDLTYLVSELDKAQAKVDDLEEQLKEAKKQVLKLSQTDIPEVFNGMGSVRSLELQDGRKISVVDDFAISVKSGQQDAAYDWLRENNREEIIKRTVTLQFDRGQGEEANEAIKLLLDNNLSPSDKESVPPQTLKASIRSILEEGVTPPESFNYYSYQKTVIK